MTAEVPIGFPVLQVNGTGQLLAPEAMTQDVGDAVSVPYGAPATETVTLSDDVPATLLQYTVYCVLVVKLPVLNDPEVPVPPPPAEEHDVALVEDQLTVEELLYPTEFGEALTETVGGEIQTDPFQAVPEAQLAEAVLVASCWPLL